MKRLLIIFFSLCFVCSINASKIVKFSFNKAYNVNTVLFFDYFDGPTGNTNFTHIVDLRNINTQLEINYVYIGEIDNEIYSVCYIRIRNLTTNDIWLMGLLNNVEIMVADGDMSIWDVDGDLMLTYGGSEELGDFITIYELPFDVFPQLINKTTKPKQTKTKTKSKRKKK